jgi:hypothetical protein
MKLVSIAIVIIAIGLAISVASNVWQYGYSQQLGASLQETNQRLDTINQILAQVSQYLQDALQGLGTTDQEYFQHQVNQSSAFQTPISKSQAIAIALAYGGWNATSLRGQVVVGRLDRIDFNASCACWEMRSFVAEPVANYSMSESLVEGDVIRTWYEWVVMVGDYGPYPPFHSCYCVNAETGGVRGMYAQFSGESVMLTEDMVSDPSTFGPLVQVGQSFMINSERIPVVLFTYDRYFNETMLFKTPGLMVQVARPQGFDHFFTIHSDKFAITACVADIGTGTLVIKSVSINNVEIYDIQMIIF